MSEHHVFQLSRAKGWRMPPNTFKVARPGRWGNPFRVEVFGLPLAVALFRDSVEGYWSPSKVAHLSDELAVGVPQTPKEN